MKIATVKQQGTKWAVYVSGKLIEGGFFTREAAVRCAAEYNKAASR